MSLWKSENLRSDDIFTSLWKSEKDYCDFDLPLKTTILPSLGISTSVFSRSTAATVTDFEGIIHTAQINELRFPGARRVENLFNYSENFSNSSWVKQSVTIETGKYAPDGTLTACKMVSNSGTTTGIYQIPSQYKLYTNYIISVYAKAAGKDIITISWNGFGTTKVNLLTGEVITGAGSVVDIGDGWYRCDFIMQRSMSGQAVTIRYGDTTGDGTSGILLWGVQMEKVLGTQIEPSEYVSSGALSWPYHGAGVDAVKYFTTDRSGNALSTDGALIEPASTNRFLNSSAPVTQNITVVSGSSYTVWGTGSGSVVLSGAGSGTVTSSTPITFTATGTTLTCTVTNMSTVQVELGTKTSYIPTYGTPVTRTTDILHYDVEDAITQGQGSWYGEFKYSYSTWYPRIFEITDNTISNTIIARITTTKYFGVLVTTDSVNQLTINTSTPISDNTLYKMLLTYKNDSVKLYINGVVVGEDLSCTVPNILKLYVGCTGSGSGQLNGYINSIKYFKEVLSESEAIRRTS